MEQMVVQEFKMLKFPAEHKITCKQKQNNIWTGWNYVCDSLVYLLNAEGELVWNRDMGLVGIIYFYGRKHPVLHSHRAAASLSSPLYKPAWFHHDSIWLSRSHHFIWKSVGKSNRSKGQTWTFNLPFKSIYNNTEDLTSPHYLSKGDVCRKTGHSHV